MTLQVGVKIFLRNKEGKYLLLKRSAEKYKDTKGSWDIVGGRINPGSSLLENLKREVFEETGLKIISNPVLLYTQDIIHQNEMHVVRISYRGDTEGEPVLDISENTKYQWLTINEMKKQEDLDIYVAEILKEDILKD
ncbi:MAG: NUDIX domain-containing protein [Candidatus Pacebacteria bacterium]|nr:NUDIX domain-containing protein [Candidatus Paceibacterota bacterium]MCF7863076.1 NUDIX domain-containing protein [Candidatus Paceibacterota bacterium]